MTEGYGKPRKKPRPRPVAITHSIPPPKPIPRWRSWLGNWLIRLGAKVWGRV